MPNIVPAKIRSFIDNNESTIIFCAGVVVGGAAVALAARHGIKGVHLQSADLYAVTDQNMNVLAVTLSNGSKRLYEFKVNADALIS